MAVEPATGTVIFSTTSSSNQGAVFKVVGGQILLAAQVANYSGVSWFNYATDLAFNGAGDLFFTVPGAVYKLPAGAGPDAAVRIAGNPFTALAFTEVAGPALSMGLNPLGLTVNPDNNEELWLIDNDSVVLCCGSSLC